MGFGATMATEEELHEGYSSDIGSSSEGQWRSTCPVERKTQGSERGKVEGLISTSMQVEESWRELWNLPALDIFKCCLCQGRAKDVRLLPCLHVACGTCTAKAVDTYPNDLICPKCVFSTKQVLLQVDFHNDPQLKALCCDADACINKQTSQEAELVDLARFAPSTVVSSHFGMGLDLLEECVLSGTDQTCDYCAFEQKRVVAMDRCLQCSDNLCSKCASAHMKTKLTRHHMVVSYAELRGGKYLGEFRFCSPATCDTPIVKPETGEITKCNVEAVAFCFHCRRKLCLPCQSRCDQEVQNPHENHRPAKLDTAVDMVKATISGLLDKLGTAEKESVICLCDLSGMASAMHDEREAIQNAIQANAQNLHDYIDRVAKQMQTDLARVSGNEIRSFHQKAFSILLFLGCSESATRFAHELMEHGRSDEILTDSSAVIDRLTKLSLHNFASLNSVMWPRYTLPMVNCSGVAGDEVTDTETADPAALVYAFLGRLDFEKQLTGQTPRPSEKAGAMAEGGSETETPSAISPLVEESSDWSRKDMPVPAQLVRPPGRKLAPETPFEHKFPSVHAHNLVERLQLSDSSRSILDTEDVETPVCDRNPRKSVQTLKLQREFQAASPTDSREVWPTGLAINQRSGEVFILDRDNARIKVYSQDAVFLGSFGNVEQDGLYSGRSANFGSSFDLTIANNDTIYISDYQHGEILFFTLDGQHKGNLRSRGLSQPRGVAAFDANMLAVADGRKRYVAVFDLRCGDISARSPVRLFGNKVSTASDRKSTADQLDEPHYVDHVDCETQSGSGMLVVTDWTAPSLRVFSIATGQCVAAVGQYGSAEDQVVHPYGVSWLPRTHQFLVADHVNHRIQASRLSTGESYRSSGDIRLDPLSSIATKASGRLWHPMAVAVDGIRQTVVVTEALGGVKVFSFCD